MTRAPARVDPHPKRRRGRPRVGPFFVTERARRDGGATRTRTHPVPRMKLQIKKFDPATMKPHRIVLAVGRRGMGKSVLMRDLMQHLLGRVDFGLAMTSG